MDRREVCALERVDAHWQSGLKGDRFAGKHEDSRAVTLIQAEHLPVIAALLKRDTIQPDDLRRNIVVSGVNLVAPK